MNVDKYGKDTNIVLGILLNLRKNSPNALRVNSKCLKFYPSGFQTVVILPPRGHLQYLGVSRCYN